MGQEPARSSRQCDGERRTACRRGKAGVSAAGELSERRLEALDTIDPAWSPAWGIDWQRGFHLTLQHLRSAGVLPTQAGEVIVQGEDLGAWTIAQRIGWGKLTPAQQWLVESVLGLEPVAQGELQAARKTQADRWVTHLAAARQFHTREGHLRVPRKHVEEVAGEGGEVVGLRLGGWLDKRRRRWASSPRSVGLSLMSSGCGGRGTRASGRTAAAASRQEGRGDSDLRQTASPPGLKGGLVFTRR
ncbi:helicase associated domain-containing protein [Streptomyces sp. NPDC006173]|uniref:helicase associated domain-containing protein n=1 Tax=Streptomyces sp. NPDC006173 TaxID=3155349 RepID=UPI0034109A31